MRVIQHEADPVSAIDTFTQVLDDPTQRSYGYIEVPDLVAIAGREKATPLLEKALLLEEVSLTFSGTNTQTVVLARELARKHLDKLKQPHWELCHSIDASDLYEAFTKINTDSSSDSQATSWYVAGLIINGRGDDVIELLAEQAEDGDSNYASGFLYRGYGLMSAIEQAGHSERLYRFLKSALTAHPKLQFWDTYVTLAAKRGRSDEVIRVIDEVLRRDDLQTSTHLKLEKTRADALLANDQIEVAVTEYLSIL